MARTSRRSISVALLIVFGVFVVLGLPDGVLGTVWPTQRADLGLPIGDLSWVIVGLTAGYMSGSVASGHVTARRGTGFGMLIALATSVIGLIGFSVAPNLPTLVAVAVVAGGGAGLLDPIVNAWVSLRHSARAMGFLHGFFGVGAAFGSPFATAAIDNGYSWRAVFIAIGLAQLALMGIVWLRRHDYDIAVPDEPEEVASGQRSTRRSLLWMTLGWFFLIVGMEVSVSAWAFSMLVEERSVAPETAALWVASFWGALTAGRFALGFIGERYSLELTLAWSVVLTLVGSVAMWASPNALPVGVSLPILGLGISLMFPVMVLLTPRWLGREGSAVATGYQFGAASVGAVVFSIAIGRLADRVGLEALGPFLFVAALVTGILLVAMRAAVQHTAQPPGAVATGTE